MSPFMSSGSGSALSVIVWAILIFMIVGYMLYRFAIVTVLRKHLHALPAEYQEPPEAVIWMAVFPGLPCLVNFFIFPSLVNSYWKALEARGQGEESGLRTLVVAAWLYPVLYPIAFLPYVAPQLMPIGRIDTEFEMLLYLALMYGDIPVLIYIAQRFSTLEKIFRDEKQQPKEPDNAVSPRRKNALRWLSRDEQ